jgi:hypothetical protein
MRVNSIAQVRSGRLSTGTGVPSPFLLLIFLLIFLTALAKTEKAAKLQVIQSHLDSETQQWGCPSPIHDTLQ